MEPKKPYIVFDETGGWILVYDDADTGNQLHEHVVPAHHSRIDPRRARTAAADFLCVSVFEIAIAK